MTKNLHSLRNVLKRQARYFVSGLDSLFDRYREPTIVGKEYVTGLNRLSGIYPSTILTVRHGRQLSGHIKLGQGVYLGRRVELEAGKIEIDDDTSLQDGCAVRGNVSIGAHCLFGHNGLVTSTSHQFRHKPEWLIRDQDAASHAEVDTSPAVTVQIDDDCWFGWGCTVMPDVHIGRGAIVGANCVVTKDIGPYEVHGGAPNRKIGQRLLFAPPESITAVSDDDLPYFYRGFRLLQQDLKQSREDGVIFARANAAVVLAGPPENGVLVKGRLLDEDAMTVQFWLNGFDLGSRAISPGDFEIDLSTADERARVDGNRLFSRYTLLEWRKEKGAGRASSYVPCYGISTVALLKAGDGKQEN